MHPLASSCTLRARLPLAACAAGVWLLGLSAAQAGPSKPAPRSTPVVSAPLSWLGGAEGWTPALRDAVLVSAQAAAQQAFQGDPAVQIQAEAGRLDARFQLAPCAQVEVQPAVGAPAWGSTRIGLRCLEGSVLWQVSVPVQVRVRAPALVARRALLAGRELQADDVQEQLVDWPSPSTPWLTGAADQVSGRSLSRAVAAGAALPAVALRERQWFAQGEPVQVAVAGPGFVITARGQALSAGLEGRPVRVQMDNGQILTGRAVADRRVEVRP